MNLLNILLQAPAGVGGNQMTSILMLVGIVVVFYFFMIRPQQKKQKEIRKMREALKTGDKVVTSGGIYGKIKEVNDTNFVIEIAENVRIKVDKSSVFVAADDIQAPR